MTDVNPGAGGLLAEIISDDEIARVHGHANFGSMSPREVVNDGVRKTAVGYHCGHTQFSILREHGLITKPRRLMSYDADLTQKGKRYGRALYSIDALAARAQPPAGEVVKPRRFSEGVDVRSFYTREEDLPYDVMDEEAIYRWREIGGRGDGHECVANRNSVRRFVALIDRIRFYAAHPAEPAAPDGLTVWYGKMPESNGRENWTATLRRVNPTDKWDQSFCFARSEYPGRVLYEADRMRWIIGERAERPDILAYDADAHSGYVEPAPDGGERERVADRVLRVFMRPENMEEADVRSFKDAILAALRPAEGLGRLRAQGQGSSAAPIPTELGDGPVVDDGRLCPPCGRGEKACDCRGVR